MALDFLSNSHGFLQAEKAAFEEAEKKQEEESKDEPADSDVSL